MLVGVRFVSWITINALDVTFEQQRHGLLSPPTGLLYMLNINNQGFLSSMLMNVNN